jgi:hypothetical protein
MKGMGMASKIFLSNLLFLCAGINAVSLPHQWNSLTPILNARASQKEAKMKLNQQDIVAIEILLAKINDGTPNLLALQYLLPKTTLELLRAIAQRNVETKEAESMAEYLKYIVESFKFENIPSFDENTSHIIGREWSEIDYSGENMTWEKQKMSYAPYDIQDFKSTAMLKNFFSRESQLPYFKKIYRPQEAPLLVK